MTLEHRHFGATAGFPVVLHHGLVGSAHVGDDWAQASADAGIHLIAVARPGYGQSPPVEMSCIADWFTLVAPVLDTVDAYAVWGVSAGAPYAYALAAQDPRVTRVAATSGLGHVADAEVRALYNQTSQQAFDFFRTGHPDEVRRYWNDALGGGVTHDAGREAILQQRPWGFDLAGIGVPVALWHAREDTMVPFATAERMRDTIPGAVLHEQAAPVHVPTLDTVRAALAFLGE